jgi:hypothetical protein
VRSKLKCQESDCQKSHILILIFRQRSKKKPKQFIEERKSTSVREGAQPDWDNIPIETPEQKLDEIDNTQDSSQSILTSDLRLSQNNKTLKFPKSKKAATEMSSDPIYSQYADGTPVYKNQRPDRLPATSRPLPDPEALGEHSRLRWDEHNQKIYQAREFDNEGNPVRDIDFTIPMDSFGKPRKNHSVPEQHRWKVNDSEVGAKSGFKRSRGEPLE